jgi:hypothetical protein
MTRDWNTSGPPPELLAAYADGALAGAEHERVANWLAVHPEGRAEVAELRRLQQLIERTQPREPTPACWDGVLDRVHTTLMPPRVPPRRLWRPSHYLAVAAALMVIGLARVLWVQRTSAADANASARIADLESRLTVADGRVHCAERRATEAEQRAVEAAQRAEEATCCAHLAEDRASEAERRAEASALDMASTPHLDLLSHSQVRLLDPASPIRPDDWATPMVVDPVLNGRQEP